MLAPRGAVPSRRPPGWRERCAAAHPSPAGLATDTSRGGKIRRPCAPAPRERNPRSGTLPARVLWNVQRFAGNPKELLYDSGLAYIEGSEMLLLLRAAETH